MEYSQTYGVGSQPEGLEESALRRRSKPASLKDIKVLAGRAGSLAVSGGHEPSARDREAVTNAVDLLTNIVEGAVRAQLPLRIRA